jgi:hypothetical protein
LAAGGLVLAWDSQRSFAPATFDVEREIVEHDEIGAAITTVRLTCVHPSG